MQGTFMEMRTCQHPISMRKTYILFSIFIMWIFQLHAQQKLDGSYDKVSNTFQSQDRNILVKEFDKSGLAPFMIKAKDSFEDQNNRVGYIDTVGNIIIKADYTNCSYFNKGYAIIAQQELYRRKLGLIDKRGKMIIPIQYDRISKCTNGLFMVENAHKIRFIDPTGKVIVPPSKYSAFAMPHPTNQESTDDVGHIDFRWELLPFYNYVKFKDYIGVKADEKWLVIDRNGKEILPSKYDGIETFKGNVAAVKIGEKFGLINSKGNVLIPPLYDQIEVSDNNVAIVTKGRKMGVLTLDNKELVSLIYDKVTGFGKNFFLVGNDGKWGLIAANDHLIIPVAFWKIERFNESYIASNSAGSALFDSKGNRMTEFIYEAEIKYPVFGNTKNGFIVFNKIDKAYQYYDKLLDIEATPNEKRQLFYYDEGGWGLMNINGQEITKPLFDKLNIRKVFGITVRGHSLIAVSRDDKWGVINRYGEVIVDLLYDDLTICGLGFIVQKEGKFGAVSFNGKILIPVKYSKITYENGHLVKII